MIVATHDIGEAAVLADRVIVSRPHPGRVNADLRQHRAALDSAQKQVHT